ncbi:VWA domain-containing protein [Sporosarcina sp. GW1-11]|uniref:VWA domain-containing protein n=1 Tax=Sporosarcina sp. GW1-11 TaxID=2899126 RepID=UPI00294E6E52|nr:VWA domain-containing protein [Sporosarcina sp. GW1-11]MDV6378752.1 VWA domain-containing protein [Sporosarcina sp. GW1-11]
MKIQLKVIAVLALVSVLVLFRQPLTTEAANEYANQSCGLDHGRDIVFVIQDTPEMQRQDPSQDRLTVPSAFVDTAGALDRFGVIGFNEGLTKSLPLTSNTFKVKEELQKLSSVSTDNGIDVSAGLEKAIKDLSKTPTVNDKIIVLLTVGTSINNVKILDLAQEAYEKDIQIHTIGFGDTASSILDIATLTKIADMTGGNYNPSVNAAYLQTVLENLQQQIADFPGREVRSDWTLTSDVTESRGLLVHENVKINLNGYNLTVNEDLVLLKCAEVRVVNGKVLKAKNVEQKSGSSIRLSNSQLYVVETLKQDGLLVVNGDYKGVADPEVLVKTYNQRIHGYLNLTGQTATVSSNFVQEGRVDLAGGLLHAKSNLQQKGHFNVQEGTLQVDGNLTINGGPLLDDEFEENKSLNVGGGRVQVGSDSSMQETRKTGNVTQLTGQLFVNHGTVEIYGDYDIKDGWLTMIKGSMDTATPQYGEGDGDFVFVHGNFSTESKRNHATRRYMHLGKPMNDQGHLTDGVLKIKGTFTQKGNGEGHPIFTDRLEKFEKDYSRYNFHAEGRHKVAMVNQQKISAQGTGFTFNLLELHGKLQEYPMSGPVNWNKLNEIVKSSNSLLASLAINDEAVNGFKSDTMKYFNHQVSANSSGGAQTLKVDARPQDRNAIVTILNQTVGSDGIGEVKVLVTAVDGSHSVYIVEVKVGSGSSGKVTSIKLDRKEILFNENGVGGYNPAKVTIGYTIYPTNATNQQVNWTSTNPAVAKVSPNGIVEPVGRGKASIVATTADGGFIDSATVSVLNPNDLLQGIKTLEDFVSDNDRYEKIMGGLYDLEKIGIVVPGKYIERVTFTTSGIFTGGTIEVNSGVSRVEVRINGKVLGANNVGGNKFVFNRASMKITDYVEVIVFDGISNELERIATTYPVPFQSNSGVMPQFYSIHELLTNSSLFEQILGEFTPQQLRFIAN